MPLTTQAHQQMQDVKTFENAVNILYSEIKTNPALKIAKNTKSFVEKKFFNSAEKRAATAEILSSNFTLSLKWLIVLARCKKSEVSIQINTTTREAIKAQEEVSNINELTILELLDNLSPSSDGMLFEMACLEIKRLFIKRSPENVNGISDLLNTTIKAYTGNVDRPLIREAAITFIKEAFNLVCTAEAEKAINLSTLEASFNQKVITNQLLEFFINEQTALNGESLVLFINALTIIGETPKPEDQLSATYLSKKVITDLTLEHIAQALKLILSHPCAPTLAATLTAGLVFQVQQLKCSAEEAKTFLSQLNSLAVYGTDGEKNTAWILPMVNAVARYVENDYPLVAQLLSTVNEQKVLFRQVQQQSTSPRAASPSSSRATSSSSPKASSSHSPTASPSSAPKRKKSILEETLTQLRNKNVSAEGMVKIFTLLSTVSSDETTNAILSDLPDQLKQIKFSFDQIQSMLIQLNAISHIASLEEIEQILAILGQGIVKLKTEENKSTLRHLLNSLPESKTKTKILAKLQ